MYIKLSINATIAVLLICYPIIGNSEEKKISKIHDLVPYTIKKVEAIKGKGFLKLVGPGKFQTQSGFIPYESKYPVYVSISNIVSLKEVPGVDAACLIRYSSGNYFEMISNNSQSCMQVIDEINMARYE